MIGRVRRYEAHGYEAHDALDEDSESFRNAREKVRQEADDFFVKYVRQHAPTQAQFDALAKKVHGTTDSASRDRSSASDEYARGQAAAMLEDLDRAGITCERRDEPHYVIGLHRVSKSLGRLGAGAREDSADTTVDDAIFGGFDLRLDRTSDDDAGEVGPGKVMGAAEAQDAMVRAQKDAWKPGFRKRDGTRRPGAVSDPQGAPFRGASRASTASAQRTIDPQTYAPRERDEDHAEGALLGESSGIDLGGFGVAEGMPGDDVDVNDAQEAMTSRMKDMWRPENRRKRGDGASTSAGFATGEDVDPQVEMVERARLAGLQPLRRVRQGG
jgi:hypothetical protein